MTNERSARRRNNKQPRNDDLPCDELGPDDGIDPRILFRNEHRRSPDDRKLQQLCAQAARAMQFALAGLCSDPVLQELDVLHVEPAPDSRRLRVVVCPSSRDVHVEHVKQRLAAAYGLLREAVATTVRRRRAPELVFEVRPDDEVTS